MDKVGASRGSNSLANAQFDQDRVYIVRMTEICRSSFSIAHFLRAENEKWLLFAVGSKKKGEILMKTFTSKEATRIRTMQRSISVFEGLYQLRAVRSRPPPSSSSSPHVRSIDTLPGRKSSFKGWPLNRGPSVFNKKWIVVILRR